jgi:hypothetical protein
MMTADNCNRARRPQPLIPKRPIYTLWASRHRGVARPHSRGVDNTARSWGQAAVQYTTGVAGEMAALPRALDRRTLELRMYGPG